MTVDSHLEDAPFYFQVSAAIVVAFCLLHPLLHTNYVKSKLHGALRYVLTSISLFVLFVATSIATATGMTMAVHTEANKILEDNPGVASFIKTLGDIFKKRKPTQTGGSG